MLLASELSEVCLEVIAEFGSAVAITRKTGGEYNPATGKDEGGQSLAMTPLCVTENKGRWLDGVVKGEKYLLMAAEGLAFVPAPGDDFTHAGVGYKVMEKGVNPIEVEGVAVAFEVWGISA